MDMANFKWTIVRAAGHRCPQPVRTQAEAAPLDGKRRPHGGA